MAEVWLREVRGGFFHPGVTEQRVGHADAPRDPGCGGFPMTSPSCAGGGVGLSCPHVGTVTYAGGVEHRDGHAVASHTPVCGAATYTQGSPMIAAQADTTSAFAAGTMQFNEFFPGASRENQGGGWNQYQSRNHLGTSRNNGMGATSGPLHGFLRLIKISS